MSVRYKREVDGEAACGCKQTFLLQVHEDLKLVVLRCEHILQ